MDDRWYRLMTMTIKGGSSSMPEPNFLRLPFQQMMLLDTLFTMVERCGFSEYRDMILMYIKDKLGLHFITPSLARIISKRFSTKMAGFIIPRRCGKSSFTGTLIALTLAFCPAAGLKSLYTAHNLTLINNLFNNVRTHIPYLCEHFNCVQYNEYSQRKVLNGGTPPPEDFYYSAQMTATVKNTTITVFFFKKDGNGFLNNEQPVSTNILTCRVYREKNALRGQTFNVMYVDETNFIMPSIYQELIPMLSTGKARMIMMSSQKTGQDNKDFVDLSSVRMDDILMCNVSYVCANHCLAMIRNEQISITRCFCYFFSQPLHINTDLGYKKTHYCIFH